MDEPHVKSDFFTAEMMKTATMSELAEARARCGYCPKCQTQSLRHCYSGGGMVFRKCAECGTVAVLMPNVGAKRGGTVLRDDSA